MEAKNNDIKYKRTGFVLNKKYMHFMIPAMLSAVGISLSEFADSMVVSHLLSSDAFAIINLGTPGVFAVSLIYTIAGLGGSLLFAECLGRKDKKKADQYFTASTVLSLLLGILLFALLTVFHSALGRLFGCPEELMTQFDAYTRVLRFFVPVGVLLDARHLFPSRRWKAVPFHGICRLGQCIEPDPGRRPYSGFRYGL